MGEGKGGLKRSTLGIHYDKDGRIKNMDVQGMTLEEVSIALQKKVFKKDVKEIINELIKEREVK